MITTHELLRTLMISTAIQLEDKSAGKKLFGLYLDPKLLKHIFSSRLYISLCLYGVKTVV